MSSKQMTLYDESVLWCKDYAKDHKLKYRAELSTNVHKYFYSLKEAQDFFDNRYEGRRAILTTKPGSDVIELEVEYIKI